MDIREFKNPPSKYKGTPFWGWNGKLEKGELIRQIDIFKEMGFGGFQMHPRTGLDTEYLGHEYMDAVKACVEKAEKEGMFACLYDEDRWPSGFAGGLVTKNKKFAARQLLFTPVSYEEYGEVNFTPDFSTTRTRSGNGYLVACYDIVLDKNGNLSSAKRISAEAKPQGTKWYAYHETALPSPWFNGYTNVDVADGEAIDEFIKTTHEKYFEAVGEKFGKIVPTIFTDEPQVAFKRVLDNPFEKKDVLLAWSRKIEEEYKKMYGDDILDTLPLVLWEGENSSQAKYRYHNIIAEMFATNFCDKIGEWCKKYGIKFTGHMISEGSLRNQTENIGDVMRAYRGMQVPGVDNLCDARDFIAIKQAVSSSGQSSTGEVLCELYGVTNWNFDFRQLKFQGDWQAAIGVSSRCHHLSWYTMKGEAKRDYPITFSYQAPWYKQFAYLEDHYSRIGYAMTQGKSNVSLCVINPVESLWIDYGNIEQTLDKQEETEKTYKTTVETLMFNHVEFDCVSEANIERMLGESKNGIKLGNCEYTTIILPGCKNLRSSTVEILKSFENRGGKIIFTGCNVQYVDGKMQENGFSNREYINAEKNCILQATEKFIDVDIFDKDTKKRATNYINRVSVCDDGTKYVFAAKCKDDKTQKYAKTPQKLVFETNGSYNVYLCDTLSADVSELPCEVKNGKTYVQVDAYSHDSFLLCFEPCENAKIVVKKEEKQNYTPIETADEAEYKLSEPNVILIDRAAFYLDGVKVCDETDILKGDNLIREKLGLPLRMDVLVEPWLLDGDYPHTVKIVSEFESETAIENALFAMEYEDGFEMVLNGNKICSESVGYYTDICIKTFKINGIIKGKNVLEITMPFGEKSSIENMFILGNFGVKIENGKPVICNLPKKLAFGDVTKQGLAFYGGNITYVIDAQGDLEIEDIDFIGQTLDVNGNLSAQFAPYKTEVETDKNLEITVFGSRVNTFGSIHNADENGMKSHPNSWRTKGEDWSDGYLIFSWGLMKKPTIQKR